MDGLLGLDFGFDERPARVEELARRRHCALHVARTRPRDRAIICEASALTRNTTTCTIETVALFALRPSNLSQCRNGLTLKVDNFRYGIKGPKMHVCLIAIRSSTDAMTLGTSRVLRIPCNHGRELASYTTHDLSVLWHKLRFALNSCRICLPPLSNT